VALNSTVSVAHRHRLALRYHPCARSQYALALVGSCYMIIMVALVLSYTCCLIIVSSPVICYTRYALISWLTVITPVIRRAKIMLCAHRAPQSSVLLSCGSVLTGSGAPINHHAGLFINVLTVANRVARDTR
jgi:hypothetical protein